MLCVRTETTERESRGLIFPLDCIGEALDVQAGK